MATRLLFLRLIELLEAFLLVQSNDHIHIQTFSRAQVRYNLGITLLNALFSVIVKVTKKREREGK